MCYDGDMTTDTENATPTMDELIEQSYQLSKKQAHTALNFLAGFDPEALHAALQYVARDASRHVRG